MDSSSSKCRSYDVFLSFRGTEVRNNFLGHLYTALDQSGLYTYMDSEELRKGEQITSELMKAIDDSQVAIIIFSKDYPSSSWCLDELTKIMECKKHKDLIVLPVFYKVEPREVRTPREIYKEVMAKHEIKFGNDSAKLKRWNEALLEAGRLSGWEFADGYEPRFIQDIVHEISTQLDRTHLDVAKYPIGIDSRVQELKAILNKKSRDDVLMIGLWGQGGVGKTTLAKAIYNAIFREFQGSSFLERVRENSQSKDLVCLQKKLLSEVLLRKELTIHSVSGGSRLIQNRLSNKKVFIILDDVDDRQQLNALAGNCEWFGKGSRIIITTRNRHLLTAHGVDGHCIYEVKVLENGEALKLFRKHTFLQNQKIEIRSELVDRVVHYCRGLPLALEVLGSFLCGRGEKEWKSTLQKLAKSPNKEINDVLKVSYDGLEDHEKEIFLIIACFDKGLSTRYITGVFDSCDFDLVISVQILLERSLINKEGGTLKMHGLIRLMAMKVVNEERPFDLGKRRRLWLCDDFPHFLSGDAKTDAIKAIIVKQPGREEMYIGPNAFTNFKNLRLLRLHNVGNYFQGPICLPHTLWWLEWPHCTSFPEFSDGPKELVGLCMPKSKIEIGMEQFKDFKKLKFINLSGCQWLVHMPDLSFTTDLEELNLSGCQNLERVHESVRRLGQLRSLNLGGCSRLLSFPGVLRSKQLANCLIVQRLPFNPNKTKWLRELDLTGTSIEELPASIENLVHLGKMDLTNCKELSVLPSSIYRLRKLGILWLGGCSKLTKFPKKEEIESDPHMKTGFPKLDYLILKNCNLSEVEFLENSSCFPSLRFLHLEGNNFTSLPACRHLDNLSYLGLNENNQLQEICEIPGKLREVYAEGCKSLSKIPFNIGDVDILDLSSCCKLVENVPAIYDRFERTCLRKELPDFTLPGGEMPKRLIPNDDGYISLMVSEDLWKKFLGVVVCVVVRVKEGKQPVYLTFDGRPYLQYSQTLVSGVDWNSKLVSLHRAPLWRYKFSGPNDWRCVKITVRTSARIIVKKCGFRLICKPLENDREVFLRHNQSFNLDLLYEDRHEGSQMNTCEEIPNETEDSQENDSEENSSETEDLQERETSREKDSSSMADVSIEEVRYSLIHPYFRNVCPGGEIPKKFILVEDGTISFKASQNLYDKIIGLALCAIFGVEDGEKKVSFGIVPSINGQRRNALSGTLGSFDSDHVWMQFLQSNVLWGLLEGGIDFGQFDESYLQFNLRIEVSGGTMKKLRYLIICRQLEDDLKVVVEDNQLVNLGSLYEISYKPDYSDAGAYHNKLFHLWRDFREKLEADMHIGTGS